MTVRSRPESEINQSPREPPSRRRSKQHGSGTRPRVTTGKSILVVDDDQDFLSLSVPALEQRGHTVAVARSGAEATAICASRHLDLVVVDGLLPDVDGLRWISAWRRSDATTPVVFVSAFWGFVESLHRLSD